MTREEHLEAWYNQVPVEGIKSKYLFSFDIRGIGDMLLKDFSEIPNRDKMKHYKLPIGTKILPQIIWKNENNEVESINLLENE
jgi:hypothetical protein